MRLALSFGAAVAAALAIAPAAAAEPQAFAVPWFTTAGGALIRDMTIAWESRGALDSRGENAVLVLPGAGRGPGAALAEWSAPGGPLDMPGAPRLFVLAAGAPCGPGEASTGPASRNPETGAAWGAAFPPLAVRDAVAVQKALADSLGVKRIRAVIGRGFGGLQALEWRRRYPHMVEAALAIGPPPPPEEDDASCQAQILRRHAAESPAAWRPDNPAALARALEPLLTD